MNTRIAAAAVVGFGLLVQCGCSGGGGKSAPPAAVFPVSGKVTYKGNPVVGADVTFTNEEAKRSAFGRTNDRGEYRLTTFSSNDGAVPGKHIVTIVKFEPAPQVVQPDESSTDYVPPGFGQSTAPPPPKSTFPEKYGNAATSGLIAMVNAEGGNVVNFDLTD